LRIDPKGDQISTFGELGPLKWKWHGGAVSAIDGCIYAVPCNHPQVLKLDPITDEISFIGRPDSQPQKYYGGVEAPNGLIYGIPNCADSVLCIDPRTGETENFGKLSPEPFKWHGAALGLDQCIYCIPSHADRVLRIDTQTNTASLMEDPIAPGSYRPQGKYKYGGGMVSPKGDIYCFPSDADQVLKIDPTSERVIPIGPRFRHHNKWQNGFLGSDNCIYAIPCNMDSVLKINCETDEVTTLQLPDGQRKGFEKWEGGVVDLEGNLWCMPQHAKHVMRITPASA
jgi:streptogramin lyase